MITSNQAQQLASSFTNASLKEHIRHGLQALKKESSQEAIHFFELSADMFHFPNEKQHSDIPEIHHDPEFSFHANLPWFHQHIGSLTVENLVSMLDIKSFLPYLQSVKLSFVERNSSEQLRLFQAAFNWFYALLEYYHEMPTKEEDVYLNFFFFLSHAAVSIPVAYLISIKEQTKIQLEEGKNLLTALHNRDGNEEEILDLEMIQLTLLRRSAILQELLTLHHSS